MYTGFTPCLFTHTEQGGRLRADTHTHKCHEGFFPQRLFSLQTGVVPAAPHLPGPEKEKVKSGAGRWAPAPARQSSAAAELPPARAPRRSRFQIPPVSAGNFCPLGSSRGIHLFPRSAGPARRVSAGAAGAERSAGGRAGMRGPPAPRGPALRGGAGSASPGPGPGALLGDHVGPYAWILRQCLYF